MKRIQEIIRDFFGYGEPGETEQAFDAIGPFRESRADAAAWRRLFVASLLGLIAALFVTSACNLQRCSEGAVCTTDNSTGPTSLPSPTAIPTPTASPTPSDPCSPVVGVNLSGPLSVPTGTTFRVDVTPVSPAGPLENSLDFCNAGRRTSVDALSANLRCVGDCSGFGPQFFAQGVGPFSVTIRVEGAASTFSGTVR